MTLRIECGFHVNSNVGKCIQFCICYSQFHAVHEVIMLFIVQLFADGESKSNVTAGPKKIERAYSTKRKSKRLSQFRIYSDVRTV